VLLKHSSVILVHQQVQGMGNQVADKWKDNLDLDWDGCFESLRCESNRGDSAMYNIISDVTLDAIKATDTSQPYVT
jgi:hypothetical protein